MNDLYEQQTCWRVGPPTRKEPDEGDLLAIQFNKNPTHQAKNNEDCESIYFHHEGDFDDEECESIYRRKEKESTGDLMYDYGLSWRDFL